MTLLKQNLCKYIYYQYFIYLLLEIESKYLFYKTLVRSRVSRGYTGDVEYEIHWRGLHPKRLIRATESVQCPKGDVVAFERRLKGVWAPNDLVTGAFLSS